MSSKHLLKLIALVSGLTLSGAVLANPINVLWYTGGVESGAPGAYDAGINGLAALAPSSPGGNTWNVTFWNSGSMPTGAFNVLVITSPEGGWATYPNYTALQSAITGGSAIYGDRLMLTGQDADWHYLNYPGPSAFDGPRGFLLDSINWAGSGSGMGLVALGMDGLTTCGGPNLGLTGYSGSCSGTDNVLIPSIYASDPINTGLTSGGLSHWSTSAHTEFFGLDSAWLGINEDGGAACGAGAGNCFVTIVSAATGGGGIGKTVPEPAELGMFGLGVLLIGLLEEQRRRRGEA